MKEQAAIQIPNTRGGSGMATKFLNIAIGLVVLAIVVTGTIFVYLHFQTDPKELSSLERTQLKWEQDVRDNPDNSLIRANLGATYLDMGKNEDAIRELSLALDQEPGSFTYMFRLGFAYRQAGDLENSVKMFLDSAERTVKKEKYPALFEAANSYMLMGDKAAAKDYVLQSISDNDMIWNSHALLGQILEEEGDIAGAKAQYEAAAKFNPSDSALQEGLKRVSQ